MTDMRQTIIPKSDQLNADDLIAGEMTITITGVTIKGGQEQPVAISFDGDNDKPYKACKSMCRVMVSAWGPDSSKYVGRSMTLYRDPKVKWAGMEVGGIRISHMSDIADDMSMALTVTRGSKKPYIVKPLAKDDIKKAGGNAGATTADAKPINAAQHKRLEARIKELGADRDKLKAYVLEKFGIDHLDKLTKDAYKAVDAMLDAKERKASTTPAPDAMEARIAACTALDALEVIADGFTDDEAVKYLRAYTAKKGEFLDAAEKAGGL